MEWGRGTRTIPPPLVDSSGDDTSSDEQSDSSAERSSSSSAGVRRGGGGVRTAGLMAAVLGSQVTQVDSQVDVLAAFQAIQGAQGDEPLVWVRTLMRVALAPSNVLEWLGKLGCGGIGILGPQRILEQI